MKWIKRIIKAILNPYSLFKPLPHITGTIKGREHKNNGVNIIIEEIMEPHIVRICALLTLKENAKSDNFEGIINNFDNIEIKFKRNWFKFFFAFKKLTKTTIFVKQSIRIEGDRFNDNPTKEMVLDELKKCIPYAEIDVQENWIPFEYKQYKL